MSKTILNKQKQVRRSLLTLMAIFILQISGNAQDIGKVLPDSIMPPDSLESCSQRSQELDFTGPPTFSENVIYPSPSSSVFKKYTGSQPSLSTGTVNIPISLYELKYRDITIPFTLRYSTSGIKVFDESYPTGLGWTLTPGLRLTRQIMNRPDEKFRRINYTANPPLGYDSLFLSSILIDGQHNQHQNVDYVDSQHDIFTLYLIDNSYNFLMHKNADGTYVAVDDGLSGLKIDADSCFSHFTVTDNSGIRYRFGGVTESDKETGYVTAWMLDSIILVNGDVLSFTWAKSYHSCPGEIGASVLYDSINGRPTTEHYTYITASQMYMPLQPIYSINSHAHLTGVQFPLGNICLNYKTGAEADRYPTLETMLVTNSENSEIKRIEFTYDSVNTIRQFLETVWISDEGTYSFDYNKVDIPYLSRYAQDWWGYYNGITQNSSRVPKVNIRKYLLNANGEMWEYGESDRDVNADHMQANILTRVHYPLGGTATFEYEPHTWRISQMNGKMMTNLCQDSIFGPTVTGGGLRVKRMTVQASADAAPVITEYKYGIGEDGMAECVAMPLPHTYINSRHAYSHTFAENDAGTTQFYLYTYRETQINPVSQYMKWHINETPVWYKEVTEYKGGGKTVYKFDRKCYANNISTSWGGGHPYQIRTLSSKGIVNTAIEQYSHENGSWHKLHSRTYHYLLNQGPQLLTDFEVQRLAATNVIEQPFSPDIQCGAKTVYQTTQSYTVPFAENECYAAHNYRIEFYTEQLWNVCDTLITPSGNRVTEEFFNYAPQTELITSKITVVNGDTIRREIFNYPFQTGLQLAPGQHLYMDSLVSANRISSPCVTSVIHKEKSTKTVTEYGSSGGHIMPSAILVCRNNAQRIKSAYRYDSRGNILEISHDNGFRIESFLWGYEGELPVAAIAGNSYAQLEQALGSDLINLMGPIHGPAPEFIRPNLSDALLQTYSYKPLVGLSANRDFRGVATTFIYDSAYRLDRIKDGNGSIVEKYAYSTYSDSMSSPAHGGTPDIGGTNHIVRQTMLDATGNAHIDRVQFFDGNGREETELIRDFWQSGALATLQTYDTLGHADRKWLPVPVSGNSYVTPSQIMAQGISRYSNSRPYTESTYLPFPSDSITAVYGPGSQWAGKGVTDSTFVNTATVGWLNCARFNIGSDGSLVHQGLVTTGMLLVNKTTDEDGHTQLLFSDAEGKTILSRALLGDTLVDTYYVYDDYGQLCYVLPPEASKVLAAQNGQWSLGNGTIDQYCYAYRYNDYGECIEKKLPGCESVLMHYDEGGRLVLEQDGNLRQDGLWREILYDRFGRKVLVMTGSVTNPAQWAATAGHASFTGTGTLAGYAINWEIPSSLNILQVNYYDDYDFLSIFTAHSDSLTYRVMNGYDNKYQGAGLASARGMLTGSATRVLNSGGNGGLLLRSMYYDLHGNLIQSHEQNHMGGYEHYYYHLTFTGKPLKVMHVHTTTDTTNTDIYEYTYDNMERLLTATVRHDGASAVTLCQNTYNSLGQLATHSLGSSAQGVISYTYNVRGWPTAITSSPFKQWLHYQDSFGTATPCWNGNISAMEWESLDALIAYYTTRQSYSYTYDGLNRLTAATYDPIDYHEWSGDLIQMNEPDYSCTYGYDLNGNITSLTRKGVLRTVKMLSTVWISGEIDHLLMIYDGNRLRKATDQCAELTYAGAMDFKDGDDQNEEYTYDRNGNMTRDRNKDIYNITYNVLNLPERIEYYDGHEVQYTYAADGRKLHVSYILNPYAIVDDEGGIEEPAPDPDDPGVPEGPLGGLAGMLSGGGTPNGLRDGGEGDPIQIDEPDEPLEAQILMTRDYCSGHIYRNGVLERIENEYGFWADSCYHYRIADYQGNVRAVISQNGVLEEVNGYYPYGGLLGAPATGVQPLKYGGKELDRENGLDWLDSQARMYDFIIGRTPTMDPMSEKYYPLSPYLWCAGNPIRLMDNDGKKWLDINGNPIKNHNSIKAYIFFDPESFTIQSIAMYYHLETQYGKGTVALSSVTTKKGFIQDWEEMRGTNIAEVNLNYHGNNQTIMLDSSQDQYITATGNGKTNKTGVKATNVQDLPKPKGNISKARLNLNTCKSNSLTQYPLKGTGKTLMRTFYEQFSFKTVRGTSAGVSYNRFSKLPEPQHYWQHWDYMGEAPQEVPYEEPTIPLYYRTGGMR